MSKAPSIALFSTFELAGMPTIETESNGFNYYATFDYYLNDKWTIGAGVALEKSRSKELHGSEGKGFRITMGRLF